MPTECSADLFGFAPVEKRSVVAAFDGGVITSDAGALLLGLADRAIGLVDRFASCFEDARHPAFVEHEVRTLVGQRVFAMALGYEDLNDHDQLRHDPVMAVLAGKLKPRRQKKCAPVAGKSTLNRLELSLPAPSRYKKISYRAEPIEALFVDLFLEAHAAAPDRIVIDLDATDDPDAADGSVAEMARIIGQIRARWPSVKIVLRGDSGFARQALMAWCEENRVDYLFSLQGNVRLVAEIAAELDEAKAASQADDGRPARRFRDFSYRPHKKAWSRPRRVVGKAEVTQGEANPRFVVTSLTADVWPAQALYEDLYCARGEMENRIKECQLDLFADRTSSATLRANQLRLWFASMAYVLTCALRRIGLHDTPLQNATCGSLRLKLLKIGALVRTSVRRIKIAMASACPFQREWAIAYARLSAAA